MVALRTTGQWGVDAGGRTRFLGQPRRGRILDEDLNVIDTRQVRAAITRAEEAIIGHLETRATSAELVEALAQLDLALRFCGDIEQRPPKTRRQDRRPGALRLPGL